MRPTSEPAPISASERSMAMSADPLDQARAALERLEAAQARYWSLLQMALRGETYSPDKLAAAVHEVRVRQQELLAIGEFLMPRRRERK